MVIPLSLGKKEKAGSPYLTLEDYDSTLMTSFYFNYLLKDLSSNAVTLRVRASIYEFWGGTQFSPQHRL